MTFQRLTQKELASALGRSDRSIRNWGSEVPRNVDGTYNLAEVIQWWIADEVSKSAPDKAQRALTEFRRERAQLARQDRQQRQQELIDRNEAIEWVGSLVDEAKAGFMALPRRMAPVLHGLSEIRDIEAMPREEVRRILNKLARPLKEEP